MQDANTKQNIKISKIKCTYLHICTCFLYTLKFQVFLQQKMNKMCNIRNKQTYAFIRNLRVLTFGGDLLRRSHVMHHGNSKVHRKQDLSDYN